MTINGENLAPAQGLGLATVLRPDYTPLRIMQQGDAVRARRAAADAALKQKQAADLAKQWAEDRKLGLDTGGLFQEAFNSYTADAQDIIGKNYAEEQAGRITTAERIQNIANYKNEIEREKLLGVDKDKAAASYIDSQRAKPFRDIQGLDTALGESVIGPDGKRVRASAFDERAMINKWDADPRTYAAQPILDDYYKGLQASTIDEANAGRIGGINSSSSLTYKGLIPVKRSDGTWDVKRDAVGRPVLSTTANELATARASNHNLNMAVSRLRYEYDNQRKANASLPEEKSDLDLFQEASQKYVSFRQADSEGRNAQPRAASGGKPKIIVNANTNTQIGGGVALQKDGKEYSYSTTAHFQAPNKTKLSTGQTEGYSYNGALHKTYRRNIPGRDTEVITNNREPQNVQYGGGFVGLVTPTGKLVVPPNGQHLEGEALHAFWREQREKNPRLSVETLIEGVPLKGKNELGDRQGIAQSIIKQYEDLPHSKRKGKERPTIDQALQEADKLIANQNAGYQFIYSDKHPLSEKRAIDANAPGAYNSREKAAELIRIREEADAASRPRGAGERPKLRIGVGAAPVQPAPPANKPKYQMTNGKRKL